MSYLPPHRLPIGLSLFAWAYLVLGSIGLVVWGYRWFHGEEVRWMRLLSGALTTWAAFRLTRGHRDGLDTLLWMHGIALVGLVAAVFLLEEFETKYWIILAWVVFMAGYLFRCYRKLPWGQFGDAGDDDDDDYDVDDDDEEGSYGHWLKNPAAREDVAGWFAMRDAQLAADDANPPDPETLVEELLDPEDDELTRHRLQHQGERVHAAAAAALGQKRFRDRPDAVALLLDLLPQPAPRHLSEALAQCCLSLEGVDRARAFRALASTGDVDYIEVVLSGLLHEETMRGTAHGVYEALAAGRRDRGFTEPLREPLLRVVRNAERFYFSPAEPAAKALLALDEGYVSAFFEGVDFAKGGRLTAIRVASEAGVRLPSDALQRTWKLARRERAWAWVEGLLPFVDITDAEVSALLDELRDELDDSDACDAYVECLRKLARGGSPRAEDEVRRAIAFDRKDLSEQAAGLLCTMHGLPEEPWVDYEKHLGTPARYLCSLRWMIWYTENGGMIHAIECLNEENVAALEPALATIGPPEVAELWTRAIRKLAGGPLPREFRDRHELIARKFEGAEGELDACTSKFFDVKHRLEIAMAMYAIEHADEVRRVLVEEE